MDEVADDLVEVLHRAMDSEKIKKERRRRDQERNFDANDEALLERCVRVCVMLHRVCGLLCDLCYVCDVLPFLKPIRVQIVFSQHSS